MTNSTQLFVSNRCCTEPADPLDCKEIKPVNPKGNQPWIFIGRTDATADVLILRPSDTKSWLIGKDPDAEKEWTQKDKKATEDEMVGWHRWLNGHEFEQSAGGGDGQEAWRAQSMGSQSRTRLSDWATKSEGLICKALWCSLSSFFF